MARKKTHFVNYLQAIVFDRKHRESHEEYFNVHGECKQRNAKPFQLNKTQTGPVSNRALNVDLWRLVSHTK